MSTYLKNPSQKDRILELLKERKERGVYAWELTHTDFMRDRGGAIMQYNARIWKLRGEGYDIVNTKPGHFVLRREEPEQATLL